MNNKYYIASYCAKDINGLDMINDKFIGIFSSREEAEEAIKIELKFLKKVGEAIKIELKSLNLDMFKDFNFEDDLFEYSFSIKERDEEDLEPEEFNYLFPEE